MFDIIIANNKHIINKIKNHNFLNSNDIDLIKYNLNGYNNALCLIDCLLKDKKTNKYVQFYINKLQEQGEQ